MAQNFIQLFKDISNKEIPELRCASSGMTLTGWGYRHSCEGRNLIICGIFSD